MLALHVEGSNACTTVLTTVSIVVDNGSACKDESPAGKAVQKRKRKPPTKKSKTNTKTNCTKRTSRKETAVQLGMKGCFVPNLNLNKLICLDVPLFTVTWKYFRTMEYLGFSLKIYAFVHFFSPLQMIFVHLPTKQFFTHQKFLRMNLCGVLCFTSLNPCTTRTTNCWRKDYLYLCFPTIYYSGGLIVCGGFHGNVFIQIRSITPQWQRRQEIHHLNTHNRIKQRSKTGMTPLALLLTQNFGKDNKSYLASFVAS